MRRCVAGCEILVILEHCHSGLTGGHHGASIIGIKVYETRFYWPSIFKDAKDYVTKCDACQKSGNTSLRNEMPQNNIQVCEVFDIWGLDFMGPFPDSRVLLNKLPSKEKDPGSFTIPCNIGHLHIDNALAGLGASISLMPYTMYEKLGLWEPKPTRISLELADRSIQYPWGIAEDVLIKIDKFVLPIDFVILDMREDFRISIILGRPFLATARAMIDVFNKKITLRVGSEEVIFDIDQSMKKPRIEDDECYGIDDLDTVIQSAAQELLENENLEDSVNRPNFESRWPNYETPIRRIDHINTPYSQETQEQEETLSEKNVECNPINLPTCTLFSRYVPSKLRQKKPELLK
ncbi:DNA-directed DNA polymerase [Tanacetum coccineum]